jgi:hypothetical protein
MGDIVEKDID